MKYLTMTTLLVTLAGLAACQQKAATVASDTSESVAVVNGTPITRDFYDFYLKGVSGNRPSSEITKEQREMVLDTLVRAQVVAEQADKDGITRDKDIVFRIQLGRLSVLQQAEFERYVKDHKPTDAELHAEYDAWVASQPHVEYHARHILVPTEAAAQQIIEQLGKGANFADLAKHQSTDGGSRDNGGDLGWFKPETMVKEFGDALATLKPGQYTKTPVKSQFGWHVIRLEETRELAAPPFDSVRQNMEQDLVSKNFRAFTDGLMKGAKIERKPVS